MANRACLPSSSIGSFLPKAFSTRASRADRAASSNRRSTSTWQRDRSAALSSNDGFSVVAPIKVTVPSST